ncbi:MAG: hypothetical protein MJA83_05170 [Gammaproteobacteria bacterium]|nr:hypothetical protein [Gammaproteobacteria bacterium]
MKRFLAAICRFVGHPGVELTAGLIMAGVAIWSLTALADITKTESAHGEFGIVILGVFLVIRSFAVLMESVELIAEGSHGFLKICHTVIVEKLCAVARNPSFELLTALFLLSAGIIEAWEILEKGVYESAAIGYFGIILLSISMLSKALLGLLDGLLIIEHGRHSQGWLFQAVRKLGQPFRHPGIEVLVGLVVIITGIWEEIILEVTHTQGALMRTNHIIITYGFIHLIKFTPHLFASLEVLGDVVPKSHHD